jgi:hypothetical protein
MRKTMTFTKLRSGLTVAAALVALMVTAAAPPDIVSTTSDPVGDTIFNNVPAFQDFVRSELRQSANGDFHFLMEMAAPIPDAPELPPQGSSEIWWFWIFDLDPDTRPVGFPWKEDTGNSNDNGKPSGRPPEFMVVVSWNGTTYAGYAIDRRPLVTGGNAIVTPVPFDIDGKIVTATLAAEVIGDVPGSFRWGPFTFNWSGPVGTEHVKFADYSEVGGIFNP